MSKKNNPAAKAVVTGIMTMLCCMLLLTVSACIPRDMIQKNARASAEYFADREAFAMLLGNYVNSMQDNYSDTVLCDIIYCIDTKHPFTSAIRAEYAQGENENASDGFLAAVKGEEEPNQEYGRYWHGTMVLLRPLLVLMPIGMIRILVGAVCTGIQIMLIIMLAKRGRPAFALCYLASLVLVEPWMFFTSLEYGTAFCAASVAELVVTLKIRKQDGLKAGLASGKPGDAKKKQGHAPDAMLMPFFAAVGVTTCFVDFLTTETLTFTLPMLLVLVERAEGKGNAAKEYTVKSAVVSVLKNGACWIGGYAGMFLVKIMLLAAVAGSEVTEEALAEGLFRLGGEVYNANVNIAPVVDMGGRLSGAIWHNLACLYPTQAGKLEAVRAWLPTAVILGVGLAAVYLLQDGINWKLFAPLSLLAVLPYLRFFVLSNHSYIHFFITYRAQMVTVAVFLYFVYENGLRKLKKN